MDLKLRIYDGNTVVKEFTASETAINVGVCLDLYRKIDVDAFFDSDSEENMRSLMRSVLSAFKEFYPLAVKIFPELTEEDYLRCAVEDVGTVIMQALTYSVGRLAGVSSADKRKNQ